MPQPPAVVIRDLRPDDKASAINVLTDAFVDFPVLQVLVGVGPEARARLQRVYELELDDNAHESALVAERDRSIAGVLTYSDSPACSAATAGRSLRFMRIAGTRVFGAIRVFGRIERVHPKTRHRHLPSVGVDPRTQGHGIGRSLMEEFIRRCDAEAMPAYLETIRWSESQKPSLERFYTSFGFEVSDVLPMTGDWQVLTMTRPAASIDPGSGS